MTMHSGSSIDLAKEKSNLGDEIVKWALGFGRLLIIIVEIVAFSAFIYRFVLDREIVDLNDEIKAKQAIVNSLKDSEEEYRNLQNRISDVKKITDKSNTKIKLLNDVIAFTPQEITYESFIAEKDELKITVNISSLPALTTYIDSLQDYSQIASVIVTKIDNSSEVNTVNVELVAKLKETSK
jgi:hypothetical protein